MSRSTRATRLLVAVGLTAVLAGCGVHFRQGPLFNDIDPARMPVDPAALLSLSHASYRPYGPSSAVAISLVASERAMGSQPNNELANFFAARAALWLLEFSEEIDDDQAGQLAEHGFEYASKAMDLDGGRGDYAFLCGALLGYKIRHATIPNPASQKKVKDYFVRAAELRPDFDNGAPLRALGMLLVLAPPWPAGVGDADEGMDYLERAVREYPFHPASHFYLAKALALYDRKEEAIPHYRKIVSICKDRRWGAVCDRYGSLAEAKLAKLAPE